MSNLPRDPSRTSLQSLRIVSLCAIQVVLYRVLTSPSPGALKDYAVQARRRESLDNHIRFLKQMAAMHGEGQVRTPAVDEFFRRISEVCLKLCWTGLVLIGTTAALSAPPEPP